MLALINFMHLVAFCVSHFNKECFEVVAIEGMQMSLCIFMILIWMFTEDQV